MASDASRRWLDNSGIWSCRIKLPTDNTKPNEDGTVTRPPQRNMAPHVAMDVPLESTSPSARRTQGQLADAIHSMNELNNSMDPLDLPVDPDAQATVTDFLDFTEYLPSDMIRSLTLIGNLDQAYCSASMAVNELTKKYGVLPNLPLSDRMDPVALRKEISANLSDAAGARISAQAEAARMAENVERHHNRAKNILAKLQDMMEKYPSSREASPVLQKTKSPVASRTPKIRLRIGGEQKIRKHRAPRITVPGEVLAPFDLDYESYGSSSDEEDEAITPRATPARSLTANANPRIKLKINKPRKDRERIEKTPKPPRLPGHVGTNAHSAVAGISTSNALALLQPPPEDAVNGSKHKPWLQLTDWELANLRKRMKKNAVWSPSDTMILRELKNVGRGLDAYRAAKASAEESGLPFDQPVPPQLLGETVHAEGAISVEALNAHDTKINSNKGMKLNEAKKLKKENVAKELAKLAADEMEQSARKTAEAANVMKSLFNKNSPDKNAANAKTPSKPPSKTPAKKRKREESAETDVVLPSEEVVVEAPAPKPIRPLLKRTKTETPVPVPVSISKHNGSKQNTPLPALSSSNSIVSEPPTSSSTTPVETVPAPLPSPTKKVQTPILPPGREKRVVRKDAPKPESTPVSTRPQRSATVKAPTPAPEPSSSKRPTSSRGNAEQATATIDRPRRASTARNTPAPAPPETRQPSKRAKRPAPGVVTPGSEGSNTTVTINKRTATTRKKASSRKEKKDGREGSAAQEVYDEIDDEGNVIDPDEPRYCLCNRVSFGTMIACENADCEREWFHLECVGLTEVPPRTTKWYCPQCRVTHGIGEKGEVNARGKRQ